MTTRNVKQTEDLDEVFESDELPEGWARATLRDLTECVANVDPKSEPDRVFGYIDISSIDNRDYRIVSEKHFLGKNAPSRARRPVRPGDILFSNVRTYLRNIAIVPPDCTAQLCSTGFTVIRSNGGANPSYFFYYSLTDGFIAPLTEKQTGSNYPATCDRIVLSSPIDIAPLNEQKRIVAKVEALLAEVNSVRARLEKVPQILKAFRQSVLAAAASGRLTEDWREQNPNIERFGAVGQAGYGQQPDGLDLPDTWSRILSAHVFDFVTSGSRGWARYYADAGAIFLRVGNLNHDSIELDLSSIQHVQPPTNTEGRRTRVEKGDLLISITAEVGMVALVEKDMGEAYINQHVALARPAGKLDQRYLAYFLTARNGGQQQFANLQRGATKVGLGLDDVRSIWIACPPLDEQLEIVRRVEGLFKLADTIEKQVESATTRAEKITQAILAKAFRGELVPTEAELARRESRSYEPAGVLLERIKSEHKAKATLATGGTRARRLRTPNSRGNPRGVSG